MQSTLGDFYRNNPGSVINNSFVDTTDENSFYYTVIGLSECVNNRKMISQLFVIKKAKESAVPISDVFKLEEHFKDKIYRDSSQSLPKCKTFP